MPRDPAFAIAYGDLKAGKTSDVLAAFPTAVYVAAPGALASAEALWEFEQPKRYDLETFSEIAKFSETLVEAHVALVIDDATLIADRTAGYFARKGLGGWDLWGAVLRQAIGMRDTLRRRGVHIAMTCHPRAPHMEQGVRLRGGPSFQGQCATKIPAAADFLLRAEARAGAGGDLAQASTALGWSQCYRTAYSPDWLQGSRYHTPDMAPMNLGEIMRLAGFNVPRIRGLEWQEGIAAALSGKLLQVGLDKPDAVKAAIERVKEYCLSKFTKRLAHVYWAIRDGYDRAVLRTAQAQQNRQLWGV